MCYILPKFIRKVLRKGVRLKSCHMNSSKWVWVFFFVCFSSFLGKYTLLNIFVKYWWEWNEWEKKICLDDFGEFTVYVSSWSEASTSGTATESKYILRVRVVYFRASPRTPPVICFNFMCASLHTSSPSPIIRSTTTQKLFREGLAHSSQFTMLIPLLPGWNANGSCNVFHALILYCSNVCGVLSDVENLIGL